MALLYYDTTGKITGIVQASPDQVKILMADKPQAIEVLDTQVNWKNISGMSISSGKLIGGLDVTS